jgi:hypothetical protein
MVLPCPPFSAAKIEKLKRIHNDEVGSLWAKAPMSSIPLGVFTIKVVQGFFQGLKYF